MPMSVVALGIVVFVADIVGTIALDNGSEKEKEALLSVRPVLHLSL